MADELIDSDETMAGPAAEETSAAIAPMTETVAADLAWARRWQPFSPLRWSS